MHTMKSVTYRLFAGAAVVSLILSACGSDLSRVTEGQVGVSRTELDIPQTQIGRSYNGQFRVSNEGDGDLRVTNIEIVDASPFIQFSTSFMTQMAIDSDWRQASTGQSWDAHPAFVLRSRDAIQVDVVFQPTSTDLACPTDGNTCGRVVITTNDRTNPSVAVDIRLNQSSGSIEVDPSVVQFPDIVGGPYTDSFTITNRGAGPLNIRSVADPGVEGITFVEDSNRQEPFSLAAGTDATYNVTFNPVTGVDYCGGAFDPDTGCTLGTMLIDSDDAQGNQVAVTLIVGGVSVPDIDVSTTTVEFDAAVDDPDTQTLDVSNVGGANLNWNLRIDPPDVRAVFAMEVGGTAVSASGQQMSPLQSGNTETVSLTLSPVDESVIRGELVITAANDPDESVTRVDLFGGEPVPELEVEPTQLNYPEVAAGTSATMQLVLVNTGRATLNISSGDFTQNPGAPENPEFSVSPPLAGQTIAAGGRLAVTVTYDRPDGDLGGLDHAVLRILSDALAPNNDFSFNIFAAHQASALPPTAVIDVTPAEPYTVGQTITLDGSTSTAPDDGELVANPYNWAVSSAPVGSTAGLSSDFEATTTLVPDVAGTYTVLLTVTATIGASVTTQGQVSRNLLVVAE